MALQAQPSEATVMLIGKTRPREYEAGVIGRTAFPAGSSYRVCVGHGDMDFTVLKVKSENVPETWEVIRDCGFGVSLDISYRPGSQDRQAELISCELARPEVKANGAGKATVAASA